MMDGRMSITEAAQQLEVSPKTIMRWEKSGKVKKAKRDWRGWRFYTHEDVEKLKNFKLTVFYETETVQGETHL
ncbi:MAG: MerR family transcriptional regulator [Candidatus Omnitrophica bacterium]|jgi:Predicted transcriptional regulators|nr:MerR family transcriptional regulator [Candidatus Omnitrophota bacterium]